MSKGPWLAKEAIESYIEWAEITGIFPDIYGEFWREYQTWLIDQAQIQLWKLALHEGLPRDKGGISYDDMELYFRHRFPSADKPLLGKTIFRAHKEDGTLRFNHAFYLSRLANQIIVSDGRDIEEIDTENINEDIESLINTKVAIGGSWDSSSVRIEDWALDALAYTQVLSRIVKEAKGHPDKTYLQHARDLLHCIKKQLSTISSMESAALEKARAKNVQKKDTFSFPGSSFSKTILNSAANDLNMILLATMSTGNPKTETAFMMMCLQRFEENLEDLDYRDTVKQYMIDTKGDSFIIDALFIMDALFGQDDYVEEDDEEDDTDVDD